MRIPMNLKKLLWPVFCGMLALTMACSSDSTTPTDPGNPQPGGDSNPGTNPSDGGGSAAYVSPVALSTSANKEAASAVYNKWLEWHFVTKTAEAQYYQSIANKFDEVFGGYDPVGRVIWSAQNGNSACTVNTTNSNMASRGCTVSEGIGYGMVLSYFQGDTQTFHALWNFSRALRAYTGSPFTPWLTSGFTYSITDRSSATDADLDIAASLVLMHYKTGVQDYLNDALVIIKGIWEQEVEQPSLLLLSGDTDIWKKDPTFNLSYFSPVALRLFAMVDNAHNWKGVLDNMYAYMKKVQDAGTGVFPDWSDAAGAAKNPPNNSAKSTYFLFNKESVRIPWRIAWDYYWFQDERAKAILDKLNAFIADPSRANGDPTSLALAKMYSWNTSVGADLKGGSAVPNQWLAAWCLTGISGNTDWLNKCTAAVNQKWPSNSSTSYFSDILLSMYSQLLNGLYQRPF